MSSWWHNSIQISLSLSFYKVTVYNNSLPYDISRVFMMYAQEGFVDFRQAPNAMPDEGELTILLNMSPTINDCMYRNMYRYKKVN